MIFFFRSPDGIYQIVHQVIIVMFVCAAVLFCDILTNVYYSRVFCTNSEIRSLLILVAILESSLRNMLDGKG